MSTTTLTASVPLGLPRIAVVVGAALIRWGRDRAVPAVLTHEEQARRLQTAAAAEQALLAVSRLPRLH